MMHWDVSREMEMEGEKVTIFAAGSHKADGNPFGPLPPEVAAAFQARIDSASANFCAYVAEMRGKPVQEITDLQANTFDAPQALALGLVDSVAPAPEAFAAFLASLSDDLEDEESGVITLEATMPDPTAAEGAASERARIQAILSSPEADGRGKLAQHLAFNTTQSAADAVALLALAGACEAPSDEPAPAAEMPDGDSNAFRAEAQDRAYAGEWARSSDGCNDQREVWTIEENRMGMKRERFCVFERIFTTANSGGPEQGWSASARWNWKRAAWNCVASTRS